MSEVIPEYNGFKNYPTWNLKLWIDNESSLYRVPVGMLEQIAQSHDDATRPDYFTREEAIRFDLAKQVQEWAEEQFLDPVTEANGPAGPHTDILRWGWSHIDWQEIAQSYMDDYPETWQE